MVLLKLLAMPRACPGAALLLAALVAMVGAVPAAPAGGGFGDITCGGNQAFLLPALCSRACMSGGLAHLNFCALNPQTKAFNGAGDDVQKVLQQQYNKALFARGGPADDGAKLALGCKLINNLYPPYGCTTSFREALIPSETPNKVDDPDYLAKFVCDRKKGNRFTFTRNVFWTSPDYILSTIGHELVHADQCARRPSDQISIGVDRVQYEMDELEAYSWEARKDSFPRTFTVKPADLTVMRPDEAKSVQDNYACAQWLTDDAVAKFLPGAPYFNYVGPLRAYLQQDPWAKAIWLPRHPQWDKAPSTEKRPDGCSH